MKATIERVENGYLITASYVDSETGCICKDTHIYVAKELSQYSYNAFTVMEVLKLIFEPPELEKATLLE
jgi:hypothetical protein